MKINEVTMMDGEKVNVGDFIMFDVDVARHRAEVGVIQSISWDEETHETEAEIVEPSGRIRKRSLVSDYEHGWILSLANRTYNKLIRFEE